MQSTWHLQVLVCDNLALPFRDESFDAVLSIAVVHHFATTERRVGALRELARVLRIGGRLVISVWAMEQRHRKVTSLLKCCWVFNRYKNVTEEKTKCSWRVLFVLCQQRVQLTQTTWRWQTQPDQVI